jgi:two-component system CheB/CheR fusion protein
MADEIEVTSGEEKPELLPYPVVAIGASAGGLEAYIEVLQNLPADTGMSFIVLSHLSADKKSHLTEILSKRTSMPVIEIANGMRPEPNSVYVLPPGAIVTISHGVLHLQQPDGTPKLVIDQFFRSLAADQGTRAIGVVLSGMDSDGALGLKSIKAEGGIAIVQTPESAKFPDMPRNSINADHVDLVVSPAEIGQELSRIGWHFLQPDVKALEDGQPPPGEEHHFARILNMLSGVSRIDFRQYKPATLQRRIGRRMMLNRIYSIRDYVRFLQAHPPELKELQEDMLINVTRFFRDPEAFEVIGKEILPAILKNRAPDQQIRIWVAGCATGEEAYSLAICLVELLAREKVEPPVQIFGTDASERMIEKARLAIYPDSISADVSPERLAKYFIKNDRGYQITKRIRDVCIFAKHNLLSDPPFGRLDLVTCRNVLIYLGQELQNRIIPAFHYALRPNGFLLLGYSETIRGFENLFAVVDRKAKAYRKLPGHAPVALEFSHYPGVIDIAVGRPRSTQAYGDGELQRAADRMVVHRYGPPGVIVDDKMQIVQTRGQTGPFLEMSPGTPSLSLQRMLRQDINAPVRDALERAMKSDSPVQVEGLTVQAGDKTQTIAVEVLPIHLSTARASSYLILFLTGDGGPLGPAPFRMRPQQPEEGGTYLENVENELASARLYLESLVEERDVRHQELISANEEIQSANEELQSSNEELETTKEELQSSNEELETVNEALQHRNAGLTQTSNDLTNLLNSVNLPILMLNNALEIRQFTPLTERLLNIRATDIGRPLTDIRLSLSIENLEPVLRDVLETLGTREMEVQDREGHWRLLRMRPYRTADNRIEGVVLILVDIDDLRRVQQELRAARDFSRAVVESIQLPLAVLGSDLKTRSVNNAFRELTGASVAELESRYLPDLATATWAIDNLRAPLEGLASGAAGTTFEMECEVRNAAPDSNGETKVFRVWGCAIQTGGERVILMTIEDFTERRHTEQQLRELRADFEKRMAAAQTTLNQTQSELRALAARLFHSQEEERSRVARELHDDIGQQLAVLELDVERLGQRLKEDSSAALADLQQKIGRLSAETRAISHRLHPSILEDLGLPQALKALVEEFAEHEQMPATFHSSNLPAEISHETAAVLYTIAQEALRNVSKHAGKTHVKVILEGRDPEGKAENLCLEVHDFGDGFDSEGSPRGLGLVSMAERARLVQGVFNVASELGKGTAIAVTVPVST